jgi:hypothetical protein
VSKSAQPAPVAIKGENVAPNMKADWTDAKGVTQTGLEADAGERHRFPDERKGDHHLS